MISRLEVQSKPKKYMSQVNLDALIPREDLEIKEAKYNNINQINNIYVPNLKKGELFVDNLRKPQFQRSTIEWTPQKVYGLIKSFTDGDLIPAVILWRGDGFNFVIDGAHRLSALIAWVNNDYGDGNYSTSFFGSNMEKSQKDKAKQTKKMVEQNIGSYQDIIFASQNQVLSDPKRVEIAQRISSLSIILQWVPGNAKQAEASFFKINESASALNGTEKRLLRGRNKPTAIASRAIIRAGAGHKYWGKFPQKNQEKIEEIATTIHEWLFDPKLETPIKTVDVPLAGKSYSDSTQELILNVVHFSNNLKIVDASKVNSENFPEHGLNDDEMGDDTINVLSNTKKMLANITGGQHCSLGLHPAIYFYSRQGRYQITSFLAFLHLVKKYEQEDKLIKFTTIRSSFEYFFWKHKSIVNQAQSQWGSGAKGYVKLYEMIDFIINEFLKGNNEDAILQLLDSTEDYKFYKAGVRDLNPKFVKDFSTDSKTEVFFNEAMQTALRCGICGGFLHKNSMDVDHKTDKKYGGVGNADNGQMTHFYCNGSKDKLVTMGFYKK
jgi:hypothetical protein